MIDIRNGNVSISSLNYTLSPLIEKKVLLAQLSNVFSRQQNGQFQTILLGKTHFKDVEFNTFAYFCDEHITRVQLEPVTADSNDPWKDWSEEKDLKLKERNEEILIEILGPSPHVFDWGRVRAFYDPKSGSSSIMLTYKKAFEIYPDLK